MGRPDPQIRQAMLSHLRANHPSICRHWFDDIEPLEISSGTLRLLVREQVQLRFLQRCCVPQFTEAAQIATNRLLTVRFVGEPDEGLEPVSSSAGDVLGAISAADGADAANDAETNASEPAGVAVSNVGPAAAGARSRRRDLGLLAADDEMIISPDYSFENFVIGPGNRLAHAAAIAVAQKPGKAYNPFFIHGGVGLGKTHLLQAICQAAMRSNRSMRIYYISCNGFMTQFMEAVQAGVMADFRHRFRNIDLLVVDDIHDLSSRDRTQEEFFHTFNSLYQAGRQIVLSSDAAPGEIPDLEERLVSRFNCGLVARIEKPCYETRVAIVKNKAALRNMALPDDVASYVAARIDSNIRELEGAIIKIQTVALVNNCPIDLDLAKQAVGDLSGSPKAANPSIQGIIDAVTNFYDVRLTDLLSKRRHKSIAKPRQIGMWLARRHTRYSLEEIGSYFGGRDHTTVMHAIRTIEAQRGYDSSLNREVSSLEEAITAPHLAASNGSQTANRP